MAISSHCCSPWLSEPVGAVGELEALERMHDLVAQPGPRARANERPDAFAGLQREQHIVVDRQLAQHGGDLELEAHAEP
jgi:hypothetical protein